MVNLLVAAAVAAATPASTPAAPPAAEPAMFVVRDADTTIYLFGTFHALDGQGNWLGDNVRNAFQQSDELVLETLVPERPAQAVLPSPGFKPPSVTPSASFLATTRMAINAGKARGMQVGNGADMVLRHIAEAQGKPVGSNPMDGLSKAMADMQSAWKRGDQSVFVNLLSQLRTASPDTYRLLFTERNTRWADWIRARMQTPGTVFVAVGAGHLAGPDSVLVRLGERGISSQRVY
jgi:hypothetical protein